jgi:hypothetical protein
VALRVSIHAPARGATNIFIDNCLRIICFNPRAREGRDYVILTVDIMIDGFNPRAREGRDL